jgi:hypothetical protein
MKQRCSICRQEVRADCDHNQGRCPHRPAAIDLPSSRKLLYILAAPFIIVVWMIMNPGKVWQQAKKDWNIR